MTNNWDQYAFHNDDAVAWALALDTDKTIDPTAYAVATFAVTDNNKFSLAQANYVVAAAAWVASRIPGTPKLDTNYAPKTPAPSLSPALAEAAMTALDKVLDPASPWTQGWPAKAEIEAIATVRHISIILSNFA